MSKLTGAIGLVTAACALHVTGSELQELPNMVVTPSGDEMEVLDIGHSVTVITAAEIEAAGWRTLPDALRTVPGMYLAQNGAPGSTVSLSVRGSRSSQVLVLVDGVRLNDPSGPTREAEIQSIALANVERIEIVRGPLSGLYGSDATAGVIHVITKRGEAGLAGSVFTEVGSYQTYRVGGRLVSGNDTTQVAVDAVYLHSDGFSSANRRLPGNSEDDGVDKWNIHVAADHQLRENIHLAATLQYIDTEAEYDDGSGPYADADNLADLEQFTASVGARLGTADDNWQQEMRLEYSRFDRSFEDSFGQTEFDGEHLDADWRHTLLLGRFHRVNVGMNAYQEKARSDGDTIGDANNVGVYAQDHFMYDRFALLSGMRYDAHDEFGGEATWRIAPSYRLATSSTRVKASVGTGFKAPSLFQLYAPATAFGPVGNADLDPERSLGWDAGVEQSLFGGKVLVEVTYFGGRVKDQIDFVMGYENASRVETDGVEVLGRFSPVEKLELTASYTYTRAENESTGTRLIRIPEDSASLRADWRPTGTVDLSSTVRYVGAFDDRYFDMQMFSTVDTRVDSSVVVDLAGSVDVSDRIEIFGRIENLFDEKYEEIAGYGTAGVSGYGGVRVQL